MLSGTTHGSFLRCGLGESSQSHQQAALSIECTPSMQAAIHLLARYAVRLHSSGRLPAAVDGLWAAHLSGPDLSGCTQEPVGAWCPSTSTQGSTRQLRCLNCTVYAGLRTYCHTAAVTGHSDVCRYVWLSMDIDKLHSQRFLLRRNWRVL